MDPQTLVTLQHSAAALFASVLLLMVVFLIARVVHVRQTLALALALAPMVLTLFIAHAIAVGLVA